MFSLGKKPNIFLFSFVSFPTGRWKERLRCSFPFLSSEGLWRCLWKCTALRANRWWVWQLLHVTPAGQECLCLTHKNSFSTWLAKWVLRIKNCGAKCNSYEKGLWVWDTVLFFEARGNWLLAAGYWQLSNIILITIKISTICSFGNRRNSPDGKEL